MKKHIENSVTWIILAVAMMISNSVQAQPNGNWFITGPERRANEAAARARCNTVAQPSCNAPVQASCNVPANCNSQNPNRYNHGYGEYTHNSHYTSGPTVVVVAKPMGGANGAVGDSRLHPIPNIPQSSHQSEYVDRNGVLHWKKSSVVRVEQTPVTVNVVKPNGTIVDTAVVASFRYETRESSGSRQTYRRAPEMVDDPRGPKYSHIEGNPTVGGVKKASTPWIWKKKNK